MIYRGLWKFNFIPNFMLWREFSEVSSGWRFLAPSDRYTRPIPSYETAHHRQLSLFMKPDRFSGPHPRSTPSLSVGFSFFWTHWKLPAWSRTSRLFFMLVVNRTRLVLSWRWLIQNTVRRCCKIGRSLCSAQFFYQSVSPLSNSCAWCHQQFRYLRGNFDSAGQRSPCRRKLFEWADWYGDWRSYNIAGNWCHEPRPGCGW